MSARVRAPFVCQAVSTAAWRRPSGVDPTRTALREAAYILRTRFEWGDGEVVDFTKRRADLFMSGAILPYSSDSERRARSCVGSRPTMPPRARAVPTRSERGMWSPTCRAVARKASGLTAPRRWFGRSLPDSAIAEMAGHMPFDGKPPHLHLLVAPRHANDRHGYGRVAFCIYRRLNEQLRASWLDWLA